MSNQTAIATQPRPRAAPDADDAHLSPLVRRLTAPSPALAIRPLSPSRLEEVYPILVELLRESVASGAALGFLPGLTSDEARNYWLSLRPELLAGSRLLLVAVLDNRIVGTGQLALAPWSNAQHRAEIHKVLVASSARGQGVGKALMAALHAAARERGRSLLLLNTRHGDTPQHFYQALGYREAGVIPGYSAGATGRFDTVWMYHELAS
jgi:ribosomal protein S18 acetylase RimI-like enzyme